MTEPKTNRSGESFQRKRKIVILFVLLGTLSLSLFILDIVIGSVKIPVADILRLISEPDDSPWWTIINKFRVPKAVTAVLAGMALSVSGLQMQTLFRNPMAGPYVLGVSSGASLGVAMVILGYTSFHPQGSSMMPASWLMIVAACAGAGAVMFIITILALRVRDIFVVLILGIMIAGGISAIVTIMQYFTTESMLRAYVIWTMGSLGNITGQQLNALSVTVIAGLLLALFTVKMMNALLLGETYARSTGVNIRLAHSMIFLSTSILAGGVTAFCGPIGFIGIAVPHIARMIFRTSDNRILFPATLLTGASLMLLSDIVSQMPGRATVLPLNSVTALLGIPVVIWVVLRERVMKTAV